MRKKKLKKRKLKKLLNVLVPKPSKASEKKELNYALSVKRKRTQPPQLKNHSENDLLSENI
jgi:hypothetical protein